MRYPPAHFNSMKCTNLRWKLYAPTTNTSLIHVLRKIMAQRILIPRTIKGGTNRLRRKGALLLFYICGQFDSVTFLPTGTDFRFRSVKIARETHFLSLYPYQLPNHISEQHSTHKFREKDCEKEVKNLFKGPGCSPSHQNSAIRYGKSQRNS